MEPTTAAGPSRTTVPLPLARRRTAWTRPHEMLRGRCWPVLVLVAVVYGLLQVAAHAPHPAPGTPDTIQYARLTLHDLGVPWARTARPAARPACRTIPVEGAGRRTAGPVSRRAASHPARRRCTESFAAAAHAHTGTGDPRYTAVFAARPGYPLLAAVPTALLGPAWGLWLTALACGLLAGALVGGVLLTLRAGLPAAVLGQVLCYLLPTGYWALRPLSEGPALAATTATLLGALLLLRTRRTLPALVLLHGGTAAGFLIRYSTSLLVGAALAAGGALLLLVPRLRSAAPRHRTLLLTVSALGWTAAQPLLTHLLGWPGTATTLQDTFTRHFTRPPVPDPWRRLFDLDTAFWHDWLAGTAVQPLLVAALLPAAVALWRCSRATALLVLPVGATALATVAAHPVMTESDRLVSPLWLVTAVGLPLWIPLRSRRTAAGAHAAGQPAVGARAAEAGAPPAAAAARDTGRPGGDPRSAAPPAAQSRPAGPAATAADESATRGPRGADGPA